MRHTTNKKYFYKVSGKHIGTIREIKMLNKVSRKCMGTIFIIKH